MVKKNQQVKGKIHNLFAFPRPAWFFLYRRWFTGDNMQGLLSVSICLFPYSVKSLGQMLGAGPLLALAVGYTRAPVKFHKWGPSPPGPLHSTGYSGSLLPPASPHPTEPVHNSLHIMGNFNIVRGQQNTNKIYLTKYQQQKFQSHAKISSLICTSIVGLKGTLYRRPVPNTKYYYQIPNIA